MSLAVAERWTPRICLPTQPPRKETDTHVATCDKTSQGEFKVDGWIDESIDGSIDRSTNR